MSSHLKQPQQTTLEGTKSLQQNRIGIIISFPSTQQHQCTFFFGITHVYISILHLNQYHVMISNIILYEYIHIMGCHILCDTHNGMCVVCVVCLCLHILGSRDVSVLGTDSRYHWFLGLGTGIENRCYKVGTSTFTCFINFISSFLHQTCLLYTSGNGER